jgi:hypothetical protein
MALASEGRAGVIFQLIPKLQFGDAIGTELLEK